MQKSLSEFASADASASEPSSRRAQYKPLNVGFIGVGNFVSGNHLPNMAASDLWNVHGVCDLNQENLDDAAAQYSPACVTQDHKQLLSDPAIDAVVLGIRHNDHVRFITEAAAAGKHILVEKPMSMTRDESLLIIDAVQNAGVKLMVGFNRRFAPLTAKAKQIFRQQHAGKQAMITIRAVDDRKYWPDWPFDLNDGGGKILCECCHFFDLLSWFLDAQPVRIFCEGYRDDENIVTIRFDDGSIGSIISGGQGSVEFAKEHIEVFCDSTSLVVEHNIELHAQGYDNVTDLTWPLKADPYPHIGSDLSPLKSYRAKRAHWRQHGVSEKDRARGAYYGTLPAANFGHFNEINAFALAIHGQRDLLIDEIDGARATACCLAAIESMDRGYVPVTLNPDDWWQSRKRS